MAKRIPSRPNRVELHQRGGVSKASSRGVVSALTVLLVGCMTVGPRPEPPMVALDSVRILRVANAQADLSLRLRLDNPNDFVLTIDAVAFDVTLDGRPAASGRSTHVEPLPARGQSSVDVAGRVDIGAVATALMTLGTQLPVDYTVTGSATLAGGTVLQFSRKGQLPAMRLDRGFGPRPQ